MGLPFVSSSNKEDDVQKVGFPQFFQATWPKLSFLAIEFFCPSLTAAKCLYKSERTSFECTLQRSN